MGCSPARPGHAASRASCALPLRGLSTSAWCAGGPCARRRRAPRPGRAIRAAFRLRVFTDPHRPVPWPSVQPPSRFLAGPCGLGRKLVPGDKAEDNEGGAARPEALTAKTTPASRSPTAHSAEAPQARSLRAVPLWPGLWTVPAERAARSGSCPETAGVPGGARASFAMGALVPPQRAPAGPVSVTRTSQRPKGSNDKTHALGSALGPRVSGPLSGNRGRRGSRLPALRPGCEELERSRPDSAAFFRSRRAQRPSEKGRALAHSETRGRRRQGPAPQGYYF